MPLDARTYRQQPFSRYYGHAGFVIYWMLSWCGMLALGGAMEVRPSGATEADQRRPWVRLAGSHGRTDSNSHRSHSEVVRSHPHRPH